jgi:SAM-dependent methyltransferase
MEAIQDSYGNFVTNYTAYTTESGMEAVIGRHPALDAFSNLSGCRVLDFGCGPATNAAGLRRRGASQVVGIDVSKKELRKARRLDPSGTYLHYDGINLASALRDYQVDVMLASFSLCTISSEDLEIILKDMRGMLAEGKELVIIDPNFQRSLGVHYPGELHYHGKRYGVVQSGDHLHVTLGEGKKAVELYHDIYRSHDDYRRLLTNAGFTIEVFEEVRPDDQCDEGWAKLARKYPPFLLIKAQ